MKNLKKLATGTAIALVIGAAAIAGPMSAGTASADVFDVTIANVTTRAFLVDNSPANEPVYRVSGRTGIDNFDNFYLDTFSLRIMHIVNVFGEP